MSVRPSVRSSGEHPSFLIRAFIFDIWCFPFQHRFYKTIQFIQIGPQIKNSNFLKAPTTKKKQNRFWICLCDKDPPLNDLFSKNRNVPKLISRFSSRIRCFCFLPKILFFFLLLLTSLPSAIRLRAKTAQLQFFIRFFFFISEA